MADWENKHGQKTSAVATPSASQTAYEGYAEGQYDTTSRYHAASQYGATDQYYGEGQLYASPEYGYSELSEDLAAASVSEGYSAGQACNTEGTRPLFVTIRKLPGGNFSRDGIREMVRRHLPPRLVPQVEDIQFLVDEQSKPTDSVRVKFLDPDSAQAAKDALDGTVFVNKRGKRAKVTTELSMRGYGRKAVREAKEAKEAKEARNNRAIAAADSCPPSPPSLPASPSGFLPDPYATSSSATGFYTSQPYVPGSEQPPAIADGSTKPPNDKGKEKSTGGRGVNRGNDSRGCRK